MRYNNLEIKRDLCGKEGKMGIFIKRPLCLFCFCFIGASLLSAVLSHVFWLPMLPIFALLSALCLLLSVYLKKIKYGLIEASITFACVALALIVSFFTIYIPKTKTQKLVGESKQAAFLVLDEVYSSKYSTKYSGRLLYCGDKETELSAHLLLDHEADYKAGDLLFLVGDISSAEKDNNSTIASDTKHFIILEQTIDKDAIICEEYDKFHPLILSAKIRSAVSDIFYERLDASSSALSVGLLTGDTSLISAETVRDFRRAGLSHVLAVSGLHLAVILGALELLLKKLYVKKSIRCVLFSFIALFILFLSGFSASAVRSVLMLLFAYLSFATSRDPDALTSLSAAGALILLIPGSATSVSFWLSFLSTLGLVSWYSVLSSLTERSKGKKRSKSLLWRLVKKAFAAIAVTLVANASICLVLWLVFGEISTISLITNLIITPLCSLYLILTLVVFVLGAIPFLCELLSLAATALCTLISALSSFFSHLDISVVSLRYTFAGIIIVLGTISLLLLLIVKLKRKIFVLIPPAAAAACFCICLAIHAIVATDTNVIYTSTERGDVITLTERESATIVDASNGSYATLYSAYSEAQELCATEVARVILTDYYAKHISTLDSFMRTAMVRSIYLPAPTDDASLHIATDILRAAKSLGVTTVIYEKGTLIELGGKDGLIFSAAGDRSDLVMSIGGADGSLVYTDSLPGDNAELKKLLCEASDVLILGDRKPSAATDINFPERVILASESSLPALARQDKDTKIIIAKEIDERIRSCVFRLKK